MERLRWKASEDRLIKSVIGKKLAWSVSVELLEKRLPRRTTSAIIQRLYKLTKSKPVQTTKVKAVSSTGKATYARVENHGDHIRFYF